MKRLFVLSLRALLLTCLFVSRPQPQAGGQTKYDVDTPKSRTPILTDTIDLNQELDSNRRILAEMQENTREIKKLISERKPERRRVTKPIAIKISADTITVKDTLTVEVPVEVVDSAMMGKTWVGQLVEHIKRCRIKYIFKPKEWGKGKF